MNNRELKLLIKYNTMSFLREYWFKSNIYYLEQLPMIEEYDTEVHEYITRLKYAKYNNDKELYKNIVNELWDHYYINHELYEEYL